MIHAIEALRVPATVTPLGERADGPAMVVPANHALGWTPADARSWVDELLTQHKAILFRGFAIDSVEKFRALLEGLGTSLLDYVERSTPRSLLGGNIYTSTEYPKTHQIPLHSESSYSRTWPRRIMFCCLEPASEGGGTPIADNRRVYASIDEEVRTAFESRKVMYVRNYGLGVDLSWQDAFQTHDRRAVEAYCRQADMSFEWFDHGACLHTEQVRPAALEYLPTGERVWFNQAHLFHVSSLDPMLARSLRALFPPERLPRHAYYGDRSAMDEALGAVREAFDRETLDVEWKRGDVLLLDNLFYSHGRRPYAGNRQVVVAMDTIGGRDTSPL